MNVHHRVLRLAVLMIITVSLLPASRMSPPLALPAQAALLPPVVQSTAPCVATTVATIRITNTGPSPATVAVQAGEMVTWLNQTSTFQLLVFGLLSSHLYLPLVTTQGPGISARAPVGSQSEPPDAVQTIVIPAGGSYTRTFATTGNYAYSIAAYPQRAGQVRVQPVQIPPDPATVATALDAGVTTNLFTASAFLYTGAAPIQTGVGARTITAQRVAVLRGKVITRDGQPLPGVTISIAGHAELGQTRSRANGAYDLVVNGGGQLTVNYDKNCYLPAQRQVLPMMQTQLVVGDVALLPADGQVTTVNLAGPGVKVARGSVVHDGDGTRQPTLLFPQGVTATLTLPNHAQRPISSLSVRLTEYTVGTNGPAAMPGQLPPNSAYTFAFEATADEAMTAGAQDVRFSRPVYNYVENFLHFPAGTIVPTGYYDRAQGAWVPSDSGRVIKILRVSSGLAELDIDGSNRAANAAALAALGITDGERQELARLYAVGTGLWRVPLPHFSSWDHNWPFGPPANARPPKPPKPKNDKKPDDPCKKKGSIIGCETQSLGEEIPIVGTPFDLHYASDRVSGRLAANVLQIPVSGTSVPTSTKRIDLEILLAGRVFTATFGTARNQTYTFTWDGQDAYGRQMQGQQSALIRVGNVYDGVYQQTDRFGYNGNGIPITGDRTRQEVTLWQEQQTTIGAWDARGLGLGGWTLDVHHVYDPVNQILYLGDGGQRSQQSLPINVITTVAGNGNRGFNGDNKPATEATLSEPWNAAVGTDGSLYIADAANQRIRKVDPAGIITTVAGTGVGGFSGDGGPATKAQLNYPSRVQVGPDGSLYIDDRLNSRVRRVTPDGIITTFAGTGIPGFSGDGGPATKAQLNQDPDPFPALDGSVYISDIVNNRIRRVTPDGNITTVIGTGVPGFSGDGGPASEAQVNGAVDLSIAADGTVYIADTGNSRIRRVGPDGIITTIAGGGNSTGNGDGGPATAARLDLSTGADMAIAPDGTLYITERVQQRVRRIGTDGLISTVAGNGTHGFSGDGGPATQAQLSFPSGLGVGPDGSLYIGDYEASRIRRVKLAAPEFALGDIVLPPEDGSELYLFDAAGRHRQTLDALTGAIRYRFAYDTSGHLATVTDGDGNTTRFAHTSAGVPTTITGPYGQRTTLVVDGNGFLSRVTDPAGAANVLTSNAGGLLTSLSDPNNHLHRFSYDPQGRLSKDEDPAGGSSTLVRIDGTNAYSMTLQTALKRKSVFGTTFTPDGGTRRVVSDADGTQQIEARGTDGTIRQTDADGTVTTQVLGPDPRWGMQAPLIKQATVRTPAGLESTIASETTVNLANAGDPLSLRTLTEKNTINGRLYTNSYDAARRTWTQQTPLGRQSSRTLDAKGRLVQEHVANFAATTYSYDSRGRLSRMTVGTGATARTTSYAYNAQGYLASTTDPLNRTTRFAYDAAGNLTARTLPDGQVIRATYDANGNLLSVTPPGGAVHLFTYSATDQLATYTAPAVGASTTRTQSTYNADGDLIRTTRPGGQTITYAYNSAGKLTSVKTSDRQVNYGYEAQSGKLRSISSLDGTSVTYSYDGPLTMGVQAGGKVAGAVGYTYDTSYRPKTETIGGGDTINYTYNDDGLLVKAGDLTMGRDSVNGLPTSTALGNIADTRQYDGFGEPSRYEAKYNGTGVYAVGYSYDRLGRITRQVETAGGTITTDVYTYDARGRLSTVTRNGTLVARYTYDANGNRQQTITPGGTITGTYDAQDRLTRYGTTTYDYTAGGEIQHKKTGSQTTTYRYDALGNLLGVTLPAGTQISYLVDGQNRRIGKLVGGQLMQGFLYGAMDSPVAEVDSSNQIVSRFVYGSRSVVPDYLIKAGVTYRIIADYRGSPRLVINVATGAIVQRLNYDAWGKVTQDTNPGFQPFGFGGGLYDYQTKLVRFGARDYDGETGRWTAKDPALFEGGNANLYGYVLDDPINSTDPSGRGGWFDGLGELDWQLLGEVYFLQHTPEFLAKLNAEHDRLAPQINKLVAELRKLDKERQREQDLAKRGICPDKKKHKQLNDRFYNVNAELNKLINQLNDVDNKIKLLHQSYDFVRNNSNVGGWYPEGRQYNFIR